MTNKLHCAFINFALLWLSELDRYSIDRVIKRKSTGLSAKLLVSISSFALILGMPGGISGKSLSTAGKRAAVTVHFRLDPSQSKFVGHALAGGLLWFKGHDHLIAARDFSGEAEITPDSIFPASLELRVKTDSLIETSDVFTDQQKQIIDKELREIVLEPSKYPEIVFRSTDVKVNGPEYELRIWWEPSSAWRDQPNRHTCKSYFNRKRP